MCLSTFAFSAGPEDRYLQSARAWSRSSSLVPDDAGLIRWTRSAVLHVEDATGRDRSETVTADHALFPLGAVDDLQVYAFLSPFPSVSAGFKAMASSFFDRLYRSDIPTEVKDLEVDLPVLLARYYEGEFSESHFLLKEVDVRKDQSGYARYETTAEDFDGETLLSDPNSFLCAALVEARGSDFRIYPDFSFEISSSVARLDNAYSAVTSLFQDIKQCLRIDAENQLHLSP